MKRMIGLLALLLVVPALGQATVTLSHDATNVTLYFENIGDPNAAIDVTDYKLYYILPGAAMTAGTALTELAAATTGHTDNYAYPMGLDIVRVDVPDAAVTGDPGDLIVFKLLDVKGAGGNPGEDIFRAVYVQLAPPVDCVLVDGEPPDDGTGITAAVDASDAAGEVSDILTQVNLLPEASELLTDTDIEALLNTLSQFPSVVSKLPHKEVYASGGLGLLLVSVLIARKMRKEL